MIYDRPRVVELSVGEEARGKKPCTNGTGAAGPCNSGTTAGEGCVNGPDL